MKPLAALASALAALLLTGTLPAQTPVPILLNYQGRVVVGTVNFDGPGQFRFALVDPTGNTVYWSSSLDTTPADGTPDTAVPLTVTKGLCSILLGNTDPANGPVTTAIPASVFTHPDVRLRVWFDDGTVANGIQLLTPDQRIAPSAYLADGSVTSAKIAANAVGPTHIAAGALDGTHLGSNLALTGTVTAPAFSGAFAGDGSLLGNVNAAAVGGLNASNFWKLGGNDPAFGPHFLGTTDILTGVGAGITMGTDDSLSFYASGSTRAIITADGNVGIGTTAPGNKLEIAPTATSGYDKDTPTSWNGLTISQRLSHTGSAAGILFQGYNLGPGGITGGVNGKAAIVGRRVGTDEMNLMFLSSSNNGATFTEAITIQHDGNVGIGKTNPGAPLDVTGWMRVTDSGPPGPGRLGLELGVHSGSLPAYSWIQSNESRPLVLNPQGNHVGIGTAEPGYRLDVVGAVSETPMTNGVIRLVGAGGNIATGFGGGLLFAQEDSLGTYSSYASITGRRVNGVLHNLVDLDFNTGSPLDLLPLATRMTITAAGKVGIGISNPQATLDVNGTVRATNFLGPLNTLANGNIGIGTVTPSTLLHVDGGSEEALLRLETSGAGKAAAIQFKDTFGSSFQHVIGQETAAGHGLLSNSKSRALVIAAGGPNAIQFGVNDQVAMTILNGGNVGIGITDPATKLDVIGTVRATAFQGDGSGLSGINALAPNAVQTIHIAPDAVTSAKLANEAASLSKVSGGNITISGANIGIGTTGPGNKLEIAPTATGGYVRDIATTWNGLTISQQLSHSLSSAGILFQANSAGENGRAAIVGKRVGTDDMNLMFLSSSNNGATFTEAMTIQHDGNVGIGTASPTAKLEVNGIIKVTGAGNSIETPVLTVTGGADVAEPFHMSTKDIPKGAVVVIDEENPGRLRMSESAYDRRVAGILSGANGVQPGITLSQQGVMDGGQQVALSGRAYVQADATNGAIQPGDMLTTSDTPGHAMKVTDHAKAQGAILGKAMSRLEEGRGMVLVLVTLQ